MNSFLVAILVIRISRDVYVLDIAVNFMLKQKKRLGLRPRPPCCHGRGHASSRTLLPPVVNMFFRPPPPPFPKILDPPLEGPLQITTTLTSGTKLEGKHTTVVIGRHVAIRIYKPAVVTLTAKKRVESILDFQLICHLHSGTYC